MRQKGQNQRGGSSNGDGANTNAGLDSAGGAARENRLVQGSLEKLVGSSSLHVDGVEEGTSIQGTWAVTDRRPSNDNRDHDDYQQQGRDKNCTRSHIGKPNSVQGQEVHRMGFVKCIQKDEWPLVHIQGLSGEEKDAGAMRAAGHQLFAARPLPQLPIRHTRRHGAQ